MKIFDAFAKLFWRDLSQLRGEMKKNLSEDYKKAFLIAQAAYFWGRALGILIGTGDFQSNVKSRKRRKDLQDLIRFADLFGLPTRKAIKALAGDFDGEIKRLRRQRRRWMARWNICLAWGYALWFVLRAPVDALWRYLVKSVRGG